MTSNQKLGFYATPPHQCNYLPEREAITLFADPRFPKDARLHAALADCGFRRSGEHLYTPHCKDCSSCIPVRIPVNEFKSSRSQSRTWKRNKDLQVRKLPAEYNPEHFELYQRYLASRHPGAGMDNPTQDSYMEFLTAPWSETYFYEMRRKGELVCIAVVDHMKDAMSAVYTFFDPNFAKYSLGKYSILYEIRDTKRLGLKWLYLGYWVKGCAKMEYKNAYHPMEFFVNHEWRQDIT